jgi:hypothetical protein
MANTTNTTGTNPLHWWLTEPEPVARVLSRAYQVTGDEPLDASALSDYPPETRTVLAGIADDLATAERLDAGDEDMLRAVLGDDDPHVGPIYDRDGAFTAERDEYRRGRCTPHSWSPVSALLAVRHERRRSLPRGRTADPGGEQPLQRRP